LPCWSESWFHCPQSSSQIHVANFTPHKKNNMIAALKLFFIAISLLAHISPSRAQGVCLSRAVSATDCNGWLSCTDFEHLSRVCFYLPSTDLQSHLFKTAQGSVSPTDLTIHFNKFDRKLKEQRDQIDTQRNEIISLRKANASHLDAQPQWTRVVNELEQIKLALTDVFGLLRKPESAAPAELLKKDIRRDIDNAAQAILNGCKGRGGSTAITSTDGATIQVKLQYYGTA
ncbi:hypothetical protein MJO29_013721, partial [Puccinia striiformis f. sp. tritici]